MSKYFPKEKFSWAKAPVRGGTVMEKSVVWEGEFDIRSAFFRMPEGMAIPKHTHPKWVQVMVLDGEMQVENEQDGIVRITAGGCYFVEPGDSHQETAVQDTLVLVTQGEDRPDFTHNAE
jgi:quercetin dioxygenase-like cupin family protein